MIDLTGIQHASLTDVGVRRSHNQDDFAVAMTDEEGVAKGRGHFFLVADGMGAHAVGELASKLATDLIPHSYQKYAADGPPKALHRAFAEANAIIHERGQKNREFEGMGTTGSALLLLPDGAWVAHVGDSRIYRVRGGRIEQISSDHSLQWELARRQRVDPEKIAGVPANVILRSLGPDANVKVDIEGPHRILPGDAFLLCSDGLSGQVEDSEIGALVNVLPVDEAARFLVDLANLRGGPDNITLILVRVPGVPAAASAEFSVNGRPPVWHERFSISGISLTAGVVLAAVSIVFVFLGWPTFLAIATFLIGLGALCYGLYGVYQTYHKEKNEATVEVHRPPRTYRIAAFEPAAVLTELGREWTALQNAARQRGWEIDWELHRQLEDKIRSAREKGDSSTALREQCRAMGLLTAALRQNRNKEEVFQPVWETPRKAEDQQL